MKTADPARGDVWLVDFDPTRGHEQAGRRPALVVSHDALNQSLAGLVIVLPITSRAKGIRSHIRIDPPEGGARTASYVKCEDIRSVSKERLASRWGRVSPRTMAAIEEVLAILLGI